MARMTVETGDDVLGVLERLDSSMRREGIRRIVEAGAQVAIEDMREAIENHHVRSGSMRDSTGMAEYHETLDGGSVSVYPQGTDGRGVRNALKAFVINYGLGAKPNTRRSHYKAGNKTGDKFITGQFSKTKPKVQDAMAAEARRVFEEAQTGGG